MLDGKLQGLAARSVVVLDTDGTVLHSELVRKSRTRTTTQRSPPSADPRSQSDHCRARASGPPLCLGSAEQVVDPVLGIAIGRAFLVTHRRAA